ncbi:MAG: undecaprenyl-phosphate glucose phosphotransferase [Cyclobacteriaceae bacterium]|nr:undecaprenyl-phosphate glucose phosphotransferase [Cyclobacteriaceae bacterium]
MKNSHHFHFLGVQMLTDLVLLNLCFVSSYILKVPQSTSLNFHEWILALIINALWLLLSFYFKLYQIPRFSILNSTIVRSFKTIIFHFSIIVVVIFLWKDTYQYRQIIFMGYVLLGITLFPIKILSIIILKKLRKAGYNFKKVIIVGEGTIGNQLANYFLSDVSTGYQFLGFFHNKSEKCIPSRKVLGKISDLEHYVKENHVDEMYCAYPLHKRKMIRSLRTLADNSLIRFKIVPDFRGFLNKRMQLDFYYDTAVLSFRYEPLSQPFNMFLKRSFDVIVSGTLLLCFLPLFILIGLGIMLSSRGPILFTQKRSGKDRIVFNCYKFRSMYINRESDSLQAQKNDNRITPLGKILRKTNLDELPQLFNVLIGDMSLIGPRPHMLTHTEEYSKMINKFMVRQFVKPGITGWAQVNGYRGPLDKKMMYERVSFDVWYIENWNLLLDIKIIFRTIINMILGEKNAF